jgi:hypothetical protein
LPSSASAATVGFCRTAADQWHERGADDAWAFFFPLFPLGAKLA